MNTNEGFLFLITGMTVEGEYIICCVSIRHLLSCFHEAYLRPGLLLYNILWPNIMKYAIKFKQHVSEIHYSIYCINYYL